MQDIIVNCKLTFCLSCFLFALFFAALAADRLSGRESLMVLLRLS